MDLLEILKNVPKGTQLFSAIHGTIKFNRIDNDIEHYPIWCIDNNNAVIPFSREGKHYIEYPGECILFPSRENRDWNTFVPDLPRFTPVFVTDKYDTIHPDAAKDLSLRYYDSKGKAYINGYKQGISNSFNLIVPIDKYTHETNSFDPKDNYGNLSDKKW